MNNYMFRQDHAIKRLLLQKAYYASCHTQQNIFDSPKGNTFVKSKRSKSTSKSELLFALQGGQSDIIVLLLNICGFPHPFFLTGL